MSEITRAIIRDALANTAKQANPTKLHVYPYMHPNPTAPAVCVGNEFTDYVGAMGTGMTEELWRLWILLDPGKDWLEAQRQCDEYLDMTGVRSLRRVFRSPDAYWRTVGLYDLRLVRYARMPADIQGPNIIDWMGVPYWGVPIEVKVRYGYDASA